VTGLPLEGVRVLDLSRLLPGGFCSLLLADFGADVVKLEDTGMGDYVRWSPPHYEGADPSAGSALFLSLNRGKTSIRVNLKTEEGREVLLGLVREADVPARVVRPGVMDRLGVGPERPARGEPRPRVLRDQRLRPGRPVPRPLGHDMNYLGLIGLLGLTGEAGGPPVQSAGQIADLGGGALMAAFGILAALRERDRSGAGQVVDVSMADGALSWLAMVAAQYLADGRGPQRGEGVLSGGVLCYRPYSAPTGWVTLGALEPKFWQAWCRGVGREDLVEQQFDSPARPRTSTSRACSWSARARSGRRSPARSTAAWSPVLDLDEALDSELVGRARWSSSSTSPASRSRAAARRAGQAQPHAGRPARLPGPALGEHTDEVLRALGYDDERSPRSRRPARWPAPPRRPRGRSSPSA
jgi:crotonobetainyl-CoA:carnitine CoA-transferase CaiB-like acyl-CoA transferase